MARGHRSNWTSRQSLCYASFPFPRRENNGASAHHADPHATGGSAKKGSPRALVTKQSIHSHRQIGCAYLPIALMLSYDQFPLRAPPLKCPKPHVHPARIKALRDRCSSPVSPLLSARRNSTENGPEPEASYLGIHSEKSPLRRRSLRDRVHGSQQIGLAERYSPGLSAAKVFRDPHRPASGRFGCRTPIALVRDRCEIGGAALFGPKLWLGLWGAESFAPSVCR